MGDIKAGIGSIVSAVSGGNGGSSGGLLSGASPSPWSIVSGAADAIGGFMPQPTEYAGEKGNVTKGLDLAYDKIADGLMNIPGWGTVAGGIMKAGGLANKAAKSLGAGTDGMTTTDAILGSNFLGPIGWVNGALGENTDTMSKDYATWSLMGTSYNGAMSSFDNAMNKQDKKYGLLSKSLMRDANAQIHEAGRQLNILATMSNNLNMTNNVLANLSGIATNKYANQINGGYDLSSMRAAKNGIKLFSKEQLNRTTLVLAKKRRGGTIEITPFIFDYSDLIAKPVGKFQIGGTINSTLKGIKKTVDPEGQFYIGDIWNHLKVKDEDQLQYSSGSVQDLNNILNYNGDLHDYMQSSNNSYYNVYNDFKNNNKNWESWDSNTFRLNFIDSIGLDLMKKASDYYKEINSYKSGGKLTVEELKSKTNTFEKFKKYLGERGSEENYDLKEFYNCKDTFIDEDGDKVTPFEEWLKTETKNPGLGHMSGVFKKPWHITYEGKNGELWENTEDGWTYHIPEGHKDKNGKEYTLEDYLKYFSDSEGQNSSFIYKGKKYKGAALIPNITVTPKENKVEEFKNGGLMNVIPEGSLHARKHDLFESNPDLKGQITEKGIPVVIEKEGGEVEQQAEIELNEIIFNKDVTKQLEDACEKYNNDNTSQKEKDLLAINIGKLLTQEIMENTDDRTGLIDTIQ